MLRLPKVLFFIIEPRVRDRSPVPSFALLALLASSLLAAGCCCVASPLVVNQCQNCQSCQGEGQAALHRHSRHSQPVEQAAFEAPLPKFHPVPTRPVFEPAPVEAPFAGLQMHEGQPHLAPLPAGQ